MFRMKFQSTVEPTSSDEDDERTDREDSSVSSSPQSLPKVVLFEGKVGKFGMIRPIPSSDKTFLPSSDKTFPHLGDGHPSLRTMVMSPSTVVAAAPSPKPQRADSSPTIDALDGTLVTGNDCSTDKTTAVTHLHFQTSSRGQDPMMVFSEAPCALVEARFDSGRARESSECITPTHRGEEDDEAMAGMISKLMQEGKTILHGYDKSPKPWEEPLLAARDQEELDLMAKEKAKIEAKRLAEEEQLERERHIRELRDLALCNAVSAPTLRRSPTFKKIKLTKILGKTGVISVYRFLKSPFRIFRSLKKYGEYPDARGAKVVIPKASLFGGCRTVPSSGTADSQLAMMRNAPNPRITRRPNIQFATVESTQRDVPAWTREEYLRKNGRIPQSSTNKKEDEEFGGIEANNLTNQYFDDGIQTDYDSDSD